MGGPPGPGLAVPAAPGPARRGGPPAPASARQAGAAAAEADGPGRGRYQRPAAEAELIGDIGDIGTAEDAAAALVFHHTELLTTQATPADDIISNVIVWARGIDALAQSIWAQSQEHEKDPAKPNWVSSVPGTDWQTNQPSNPIYVWSDATLADLKLPLGHPAEPVLDGAAGNHPGADGHRPGRPGARRGGDLHR